MSQHHSQRLSQDDKEDRVELIRGYTEIESRLRQDEEKLINAQTPRPLIEELIRHEQLFPRVKSASTMARDCAGINRVVKIAATQTQTVNLCPKSMNLQNLRSNLFGKFGQNPLDLAKLGEWAIRRSRVAPPCGPFLFGLGQFQPVQRTRTQKARSQQDELQEMKAVDQREQTETRTNQLLSRAKNLCEKLRQSGETPLARAIATPNGFAETVQNAFDFAHLIRDGKVGLHVVNDCVLATARVDEMPKGERRQQAVLHLRQTDYQTIMEDPGARDMCSGNE